MTANDIRSRIESAIPGARASVEGGDQYYSVVIIADRFTGKTRIERHQMIYALFREEMASQVIHALALKTSTPEEWERSRPRMEIGK